MTVTWGNLRKFTVRILFTVVCTQTTTWLERARIVRLSDKSFKFWTIKELLFLIPKREIVLNLRKPSMS